MIRIHDIQQGSVDWFNMRKGLLTASNATPIGANGKGLETLCSEIAMELIGIEKDQFTNDDIERGNDLEHFGILEYEFYTGYTVNKVGFITNDNIAGAGCSPDGLIGYDGGLEVKARNDNKHFSLLIGKRGSDLVPTNQMQFSMWITGRKWWDFVSFNPNFEKSLFIERCLPDENYFKKLDEGVKRGTGLIREYVDLYRNYNIKKHE